LLALMVVRSTLDPRSPAFVPKSQQRVEETESLASVDSDEDSESDEELTALQMVQAAHGCGDSCRCAKFWRKVEIPLTNLIRNKTRIEQAEGREKARLEEIQANYQRQYDAANSVWEKYAKQILS